MNGGLLISILGGISVIIAVVVYLVIQKGKK